MESINNELNRKANGVRGVDYSCGALWSRVAKNNMRYYSGNIDLDKLRRLGITSGVVKITCLRNIFKKKDNHPDYTIKIPDPNYRRPEVKVDTNFKVN